MEVNNYEVFLDGLKVASEMSLSTTMILVKGLFETYYEEHGMQITIKEMERCDNAESD